jgi:hypothetical protein
VKRFKIKEVHRWLNQLPENKWRKIYKVDAKRVAHFINHGGNVELPSTLKRKFGDSGFVREKKLAKGFLLDKIEEKKQNESINESGLMYRAGVKRYGKEGMTKIQAAAGSGAGHAEIGAIKDKYDKKRKGKKESVDEGQKRDYEKAYTTFYNAYKNFANASMDVAKESTKISGDKTDQKIILKNFKKHVIPFIGLMSSWNKGHQKNPHLDESIFRSLVKELIYEEIKKLDRSGILKEKLSGESTELRLYIDNNAGLYKTRYIPILKNLSKFKKNGKYKSKLAIKAFMYLIDDGAKLYVKDFGGDTKTFSKKHKLELAKDYAEEFESQYNNKEFNFMK